MSSAEIQVNNEWLKWARKSAYYDIGEISKKMRVKPDTLENWENTGTLKYDHLLKLAEFYQRPPMMFFNENNPAEYHTVIPDYRTVDSKNQDYITPLISFELRSARDRRQNLLMLEEESDEYDMPLFDLKIYEGSTKNPKMLASIIRDQLGMTKTQIHVHKGQKGLDYWIKKVEELGVLVFQFYGIKPEEMRGYALTYDKLPIIGINNHDHVNGKKFTLFHELAHIIIKKEGISSFDKYILPNSDEIFCNAVAAEVVTPTEFLEPKIEQLEVDGNWTDGKIQNLANYFQVSKEVIVRRLLTLEFVTPDYYKSKKAKWKRYIPHSKSTSRKQRNTKTITNHQRIEDPDTLNAKKASKALKRNGIYYTEIVLSAYDSQIITNSTMAGYLGETLQVIDQIRKKLPGEMV